MPNLMQRAATYLGGRLKEAAGRDVTIRRKGVIVGSVTAWVSLLNYQVVDEDGAVTTVPVYDWTFKTVDLVIELRDGDRIVEVLNNNPEQYEVMMVGDMQSVTPLDSSGNLTLVHTKKVG